MLKHNQAKEKSKKLKPRVNRGYQAIIRQETQHEREKSKEKNTPNPKKEDSFPSVVVNSITRKISLWHGVNHNRRNDTHKSTLISSILYK